MFAIGDRVVYGSQGVFEITEIELKNFAQQSAEYYVLKPVTGDSSVTYVPLHNEKLLAKMRKALSVEEICQLLTTIADEEIWFTDEYERRVRFKELLEQGDCRTLMILLKTLHGRKLQSKSHKMLITDERYLKDVEKNLFNIFSYALNIRREQVLPFVLGHINVKKLLK